MTSRKLLIGVVSLFFYTYTRAAAHERISVASSERSSIDSVSSENFHTPRSSSVVPEAWKFSSNAKEGDESTVLSNQSSHEQVSLESNPETEPIHEHTLMTSELDLSSLSSVKKIDSVDRLNSEKKITNQDVLKDEFDISSRLLRQFKKQLTYNSKTLGHTIDATFPDTVAENQRIRNLDKNARLNIKNMVNRIDASQRTGLSAKAQKAYDLLSSTKSLTQENFPDQMIQSHLDTICGVDSLSGESLMSLDPNSEIYKKIVKQFTDRQPVLEGLDTKTFSLVDTAFDSKSFSKLERSQAIAKMQDIIMNEISDGSPIFTTSIGLDGSYTSDIVQTHNGEALILSSKIDNNGVLQERQFAFRRNSTQVKFETTLVQGKLQTKMFLAKQDSPGINLTATEEDILDAAITAQRAMINFKSVVKFALYSGKQVAINAISMLIPAQVHMIATAGAVPVMLTVKAGSMIAGYKFSDPVMRTVLSTVLLPMGDRGALLSGSADRVFTKGSMPSRALNALQGIKGDDINLPDRNEEYYTWTTPVVDAMQSVVNKIAPETLGDRLIPTKSLPAAAKFKPLPLILNESNSAFLPAAAA